MSNSWLCIDANLVVRLVAAPRDEAISQHWDRWATEGWRFAAPTLLYYEVTNALYRYQRMGLASEAATRLAQKAALALPIQLFGDAALHRQSLELAGRLGLPAAYDAHYLALAETLGAEFWTADRRLYQAIRGTLPWVRIVETEPGR
jgi:predicted nucleic acid-binding protein